MLRWLFTSLFLIFFSPAIAQNEVPSVEVPPVVASVPPASVGSSIEAAVAALSDSSFKKKSDAIDALAQHNDPRVLSIFKALLAGNLYVRKADSAIVFGTVREDNVAIEDALTGQSAGTLPKVDLTLVGINNIMRKKLKAVISRLSLSASDASARRAAVEEMMKGLDAETIAVLRDALPNERDPATRALLSTAVAMEDINQSDKSTRLAAIAVLAESTHSEARRRLSALVDPGPGAGEGEQDADIRNAASLALAAIDRRLALYSAVETTFFGLSLGSVLLLAAIGLAITFGVMGVINMAHGELIMLGAYTTSVVQMLMPNHIDASLFVAIPAAFLVSALVGMAIERGVIRFLYGRPLETLLATFGVSLVLQQAVRSIFSPLNRQVDTPSWMSGSLEINSALSLTYNRIYVMIFALLVFFALLMLLKKTVFGLQMRAVMQNRPMARAMGIRSGWVDALTFGLGSGIAGIAGVALSQLTNVGPNLGQAYIIDSFMVVVFGGVGNLWGTFVGAMSLGVINKIVEPWSGAVLAKILVLVAIILFIQKRPRGLFPQKGRAAEG